MLMKIMSTLGILALTVCAVSGPRPPAGPPSAAIPPSSRLPAAPATAASSASYLVLVSLDGCRPEYFDLAPLPNLASLMESGVTYTGAWVGSLASNTPPGHTEMSTGTFPKHNGILSFTWRDSNTGRHYDPTSLEAINNGEMARIVAQSGVPTLAGLVKAQTPEATVVAVSAQKYYAAQGLGVGPTDYIIYSAPARKATPMPEEERGVESIESEFIPAALRGHAPPAEVMNDPRLRLQVKTPGDENTFAINAALVLFERFKPRALLINLPATDQYGHYTGGIVAPDTMRQVMLTADAGIGRLMAAYRSAGIWDRTLWVITADHGMIPNSHQIGQRVLEKIAREAGNKGRVDMPYGNLDHPAQANRYADAVSTRNVPGIMGVYVKVNIGDRYEYQPAPATRTALMPALNEAYLYLLSTFVGATSPDLVTMTAEDAAPGTEPPDTRGSHRWITWGVQHIPLVISGPGVKRGLSSNAPARLVDLAPTIARVMGFSTTGMDGVPLADALQRPSPEDVRAQQEMNLKLRPLRDAFQEASTQ